MPFFVIFLVGCSLHAWYFSRARPAAMIEQRVTFSVESETVGTPKFYIGNDSGDYMKIADFVMMKGELTGYPYFLTPTLIKRGYEILSPIYFRTPLYPLLIAAVVYPFAENPAEEQMMVAPTYVVPVQILLHLLGMLVLTYGLAQFAPAWIAAPVALVVMFEPNMLAMNYRLMAEALLCPLVAGFAALLLIAIRRKSATALGAAAVVVGLCALTKPIGAILVLPLAFVGLAIGATWWGRTKLVMAAMAVAALVTSPYLIRNYVVWGDFRLTAQPGFNFLFYNVRAVAGVNSSIHDKVFYTHAEQFTASVLQAEKDGIVSPGNVDPYRLGDYFAHMGVKILTDGGYWPDYFRAYLANIRKHVLATDPAMFVAHQESYDWKSPPSAHPSHGVYELGLYLHHVLLLALSAVGFVGLLIRRKFALAATFSVGLAGVVLTSAPIIDTRLALPEWILLAPFVLFGVRFIFFLPCAVRERLRSGLRLGSPDA
jgi:hypothetical protein